MKRVLFFLITGLFAQFMAGCYPEGADSIEDYDVAITNYDKNADFAAFEYFVIPDTIVYFSNDKTAKIDPALQDTIIRQVIQNFEARGYKQETEGKNDTSFIVTISAFSNVNYAYYIDNWYNHWDWYWQILGFNMPYPFYPYYPWYPVNVYAYRTGTVIIDMIAPAKPNKDKINVAWSGIVDGLLQGSTPFILKRLKKEIRQCFDQSPYLSRSAESN